MSLRDRQPAPRDARQDALHRLGQRPRSCAELRRYLHRRGHSENDVERVVAELIRRRWLDDVALARQYIVARARRLGHGPGRLLGELRRRGVSDSDAAAAWREAVDDGEVNPEQLLQRALRRRLPSERGDLDGRDYRRVYNALLRAGFESSAIGRALQRYGADPSESADS